MTFNPGIRSVYDTPPSLIVLTMPLSTIDDRAFPVAAVSRLE